MKGSWPVFRATSLIERARALTARTEIAFTFLPSAETDFINYFAAGTGAELAAAAPARHRFVPPAQDMPPVDIVITTAQGSDLSSRIWKLRDQAADGAIVAVWLWDNHIAPVENLRTVMAADLVFVSHAYVAGYLFNPASIVTQHIPLCTAQWTRAEASRFFAQHVAAARCDKLLVNYVDYSFSWRSDLLRRLKAEAPEADMLIMSAADRTRYFSKTPSERFAEWAAYKATVILPVDQDLSTRVFDALLAGLVPVVPRALPDFDGVVPLAVQDALGIVRIDEVSVESIRAGTAEALRRFDRMGTAGALARHRYALEQHCLVNRLNAMLDAVAHIGTGALLPNFMEGPNGVGLYMMARQ